MVWKNHNGLALPMVIIIMMVLMILGLALMQYSAQSINHVSLEEKRIKAYYLARTGAELMLDHVSQFPSLPDDPSEAWEYDLALDHSNAALLQSLKGNTFSLKIYRLDNTTIIESTGKVGQLSETITVKKDEYGQVYWEKKL